MSSLQILNVDNVLRFDFEQKIYNTIDISVAYWGNTTIETLYYHPENIRWNDLHEQLNMRNFINSRDFLNNSVLLTSPFKPESLLLFRSSDIVNIFYLSTKTLLKTWTDKQVFSFINKKTHKQHLMIHGNFPNKTCF